MEKTDYPLTAAMLATILDVTKVETAKMRDALHDVLVMKMKPSAAARRHGLQRQNLHAQLKNIRTVIKPAFDKYVALMQEAKAAPSASSPAPL